MEARLNVINSFCEFCYGLQKLKTLNLHLFHTQQNPQHRFSTVLTKTNWYTTSCKYYGCKNLTSLTLSNSLTSIGRWAFEGCSRLESVIIPHSVTQLGEKAFYECTKLTTVISQIKEPFAIGIVFSSSVYDNATLYVPSGTKSKYQATKGWWIFKNIVENDLLHIDGGQFVDTGNDIVNVYDLNGHRITSPQRGVNIVRLKDGTVRKVLVK